MDQRRLLTMNWEEVEDDDDDNFFDPRDRFSSAVPQDLAATSGSDDDETDDSRLSFSSTVSSSAVPVGGHHHDSEEANRSSSALPEYDMWMAEPGDVKERRRRLLQGMGLLSNKSLHKIASAKKFAKVISRKVEATKHSSPKAEPRPTKHDSKQPQKPAEQPYNSVSSIPIVLIRSRSAGDLGSLSIDANKRKEELIGPIPKQNLTRSLSGLAILKTEETKLPTKTESGGGEDLTNSLDTGSEELMAKEKNEFGYSPVVKEVMRRENVPPNNYCDRKLQMNSYLSRSVKFSKRRGVAILKNIKGVAHSMSGRIIDKDTIPGGEQKPNKNSSQWIKIRHHGKPYKEFTGLHLCQEIQAHEGSIWSLKFSSDSHYLASAGEDRVIHLWEVQECDVMAGRTYDDLSSVSGTPVHPMAIGEARRVLSEKRKKGRTLGRKKANSIPDYVIVPETVFSLSERPVCTLIGHQDVVLDLSWSRSQLLLSSSMDKTVRLWDVENQNCLKIFAHNDYVTCIHFNPVDEDYFISGSLDSKVRIWNISERKVVDWTDQKEMVTATSYTPDGKGAIIGSHRGSCRYYSTTDCKLEQKDQFDTQNKKKSQIRKVTGFQYSPWNPSEVLISTADSSVRIHDGSSFTHKFKGSRNTSSQISASFSPDGKYVISASEDSQVYMWKREDWRSGSGKGKKVTIHGHEHFQCKDVSVAIPWPGSIRNEVPVVEVHSKRNSKRFLPPQYPSMGSPLPRRNKDTVHETEFSHGVMDDSPSVSPSLSFDAGNAIQATAWGLVIVTASLGGEIRVYQNFGLPVKVSRQSNLFRDLT